MSNDPQEIGFFGSVSKTSDTPNLDFLKQEVSRLKKLLDNPYPDVAAWREDYGKCMSEIVDFYTSWKRIEEV